MKGDRQSRRTRSAPPPSAAAAVIHSLCSLRPTLAIQTGSGFAETLTAVEIVAETPYTRLPGFPEGDVPGHEGRLVVGRLAGATVLVLSGRAHFYEGFLLPAVTFPVRVLAAAGITDLLLTNAAGGINRRLRPGDFMAVSDHINAMGVNPLRGPQPSGRPCFLDLSEVYDQDLRRLLRQAARKVSVTLRSGVYLAVSGPTYETPAEVRAFGRLGADAIGMSTVPEAIVARQCGLRVAGLCCITNLAAGLQRRPLSHAEVLAVARRAGPQAARLLGAFAMAYEAQRRERGG
jgi:purine-nucleoside phosphorylase